MVPRHADGLGSANRGVLPGGATRDRGGRGHGRKVDPKQRATACGTGDGGTAAVGDDDPLHDRQPQTGSRQPPGAVGTVEPVQSLLLPLTVPDQPEARISAPLGTGPLRTPKKWNLPSAHEQGEDQMTSNAPGNQAVDPPRRHPIVARYLGLWTFAPAALDLGLAATMSTDGWRALDIQRLPSRGSPAVGR
jgi:hypothetical protein